MADYTRDQLMTALRKADSAGDVPAAQAIARRIKAMEAPEDFSGVTSRVLPEPEKSFADIESRARGLTGRTVAQGVAGLADAVIGGAKMFADQQAPLLGAIRTGIEQATGFQVPSVRNAVSSGLTAAGVPQYEGTRERIIGDIGEAATGAAAGLPLSPARALPQVIGGAIGGGASSATREAGGGPVAQAVAGLAGAVVPSGRSTAGDAASGLLKGSVNEDRKQIAQQAKALGVTLTPGQLSDSRFLKWAQSWLRSIPFTGAQGRFDEQVGNFNRALVREVGQEGERLGPAVLRDAKASQSAQLDDLMTRNALRVDDKLVRSLSNIADGAKIGGKDIVNQVESAIDGLYAQATTGPGGVVIPGQAYQAFDSTLNSIIKAGGPTSHFVGNVQHAVRDAMDRSITPRDSEAWQTWRRQYGARKTLAPVASRSDIGEVKPSAVLGAVTNTKVGKEAQAEGRRGNLGTLARVGQLMKEPPSSGSAERVTVGGLLGGASVIDPVTGTLTAVGLNLLSRGLDSGRLADLMIRQNPGLTRESAMRLIQQAAVPAAVVTEQTRSRNP